MNGEERDERRGGAMVVVVAYGGISKWQQNLKAQVVLPSYFTLFKWRNTISKNEILKAPNFKIL